MGWCNRGNCVPQAEGRLRPGKELPESLEAPELGAALCDARIETLACCILSPAHLKPGWGLSSQLGFHCEECLPAGKEQTTLEVAALHLMLEDKRPSKRCQCCPCSISFPVPLERGRLHSRQPTAASTQEKVSSSWQGLSYPCLLSRQCQPSVLGAGQSPRTSLHHSTSKGRRFMKEGYPPNV